MTENLKPENEYSEEEELTPEQLEIMRSRDREWEDAVAHSHELKDERKYVNPEEILRDVANQADKDWERKNRAK